MYPLKINLLQTVCQSAVFPLYLLQDSTRSNQCRLIQFQITSCITSYNFMRSSTIKSVLPLLILSQSLCGRHSYAFQTALPTRAVINFNTNYNGMASNSIPVVRRTCTSKRQIYSNDNGVDSKLQAEVVAGDMENEKSTVPFFRVLWRFTRPHTLIGSALAIPALHIFAAPSFKEAFAVSTLISSIFAMIPSLLMNLYITGLNQITDIEIDKVNKPYLPIASGDLTPQNATIIVTLALFLSLSMGFSHPVLGSQGLNVALWGSMILGTMYSLPPFRLKRFPLLAAVCIVAVRGTIINAGFFAHAKAAAFARTGVASTVMGCMSDVRCLFSCLFFAVFGIVIGTLKTSCYLWEIFLDTCRSLMFYVFFSFNEGCSRCHRRCLV